MGNLINPIGGRLGFMTFWSSSWPVFYQEKSQHIFFQISIQLRILFNNFFYKIFSLNPNHSSPYVLHGLIVNFVSNIWGFENQNLTVFLDFFDYKMTVNLLEKIKDSFFTGTKKNPLYLLKKLSHIKNWTKGNPYIRFGLNRPELLKLKIFSTRLRNFFFRGGHFSFFSTIKKFFNRNNFVAFNLIRKRVFRWHYNLIVYTKPYLLFLCKIFKFARCYVFTKITKSSVSSAMIARFMSLKIMQGFNLNFVLNTVRRSLSSFFHNCSGYKLCLSGRFTRKQIATYRWVKFGNLSLNQTVSGVDYAQDIGFSKFGVFGIKFWVFKDPNLDGLFDFD